MMMKMMMMMMMMMVILVGGGMGDDDENELLLYTRDELTEVAGYGEEKLSTVVVAGTLLCHHSFSNSSPSHPIPGASVAVMCRHNKKTSKVRGKTDEYGDFLIDLPSHLHAIPNMERRCVFRIVGVPKKSVCHRPPKHNYNYNYKYKYKYKGGSSGIKLWLSSSGNGIRTYSIAPHGNGIHLKQRSHPLITRNRNSRGRKMLHNVL